MPTYKDCLAAASQFNERRDCTVKALSIVGGVPYQTAHQALALRGRKPRRGAFSHQWEGAAKDLGLTLSEFYPRKPCGGKFTARTIGEVFPKGRYLVQFRDHLAAMIDGKIEDWVEGRQHRVERILLVREGDNTPIEPIVQPRAPKRAKNLNPQHVINAKRAAVEKAGGKLVYSRPVWMVYSSRGFVKKTYTSAQFSQTTTDDLLQLLKED